MCGCERHFDRSAPCHCQCDHHEDTGIREISEVVYEHVETARLRTYVYQHNHACKISMAIFKYNPPTVGGVMLMAKPTCVETNTELELIHVEDN